MTPITETAGLKLKRVKVEASYPFKTIVNWPGSRPAMGPPLP